MTKRFVLFLLLFGISFFISTPPLVSAQDNSYVSVVNPIRGSDFWNIPNQQPVDAVAGEMAILKQNQVPVTWLIRFDALIDPKITSLLNSNSGLQEIGLFLEITPTWAKEAGVAYHQSKDWHSAASVFLSGYSPKEREQLIDTAFTRFKEVYKTYPKSVGAWWIDAYSMQYLYKKYGITSALIVSDQYTTDDYQIWGQYFSTPFYPSKTSILTPAQTKDSKLPVVVTQWAARDPLNGYGKVVEDSTYSVQPNDYVDYHNLGTDYFSKLVDIYTKQSLNSFGQITVGLENSYSWNKYQSEYQNEINALVKKQASGQFKLVTMVDFASWYKKAFPDISPTQVIEASDPLGSDKKVVWFMNPYYRVGWFYNQEGSVIRDIHQYIDGTEEICLTAACSQLNFATFPTRVLDDVTYGKKWLLDKGKITNFQLTKTEDNYTITYKNEAGIRREISFLPRDIAIDNQPKTIDTTILNVLSSQPQVQNQSDLETGQISLLQQYTNLVVNVIKFTLFLLVAIILPGYLLTLKINSETDSRSLFLSLTSGWVILTLLTFVTGLLHVRWIIPVIILGLLVLNFKKVPTLIKLIAQQFRKIRIKKIETSLIIAGIIFQGLTLFKSGWLFNFGLGFWGPTGHDGIWHQALVSQLIQNVPPQNPIFSGQTLSGYHYFYDLLVAQTAILTQIPIIDLIYRFYPILISLLLGIGTILLSNKIFKNRKTTIFALFLVYFAGSFGWIVDFIKGRQIGGESDFWINQPVSMNLNPPFAISLVLMIAVVLSINLLTKSKIWKSLLIILLAGTLIEFKVYGGIVVLLGLGGLSIYKLIFKRSAELMLSFLGSLLLSAVIFLPQNTNAEGLLIYSPFWFINSMIDFPDRVGWFKLSSARNNYLPEGKIFKYVVVQILSFGIFLFGNLGMRFIALFGLAKLFGKKFYQSEEQILLFLIGLFSFAIPTIFIQKGNSWNTIQFSYYFLYIAALFAAAAYTWIFSKLAKSLKIFILVVILTLTPISAVTTFRTGLYPNPASQLPFLEYQALNFLHTQPQGIVLAPPYDGSYKQYFAEPQPLLTYDTTGYVSAFSGQVVFEEDEIQQEILQTDYQKRLVEEKEFFSGGNISWAKDFLAKNNIKYIYYPKIYGRGLDESSLGIKHIYENKDVIIYQLNDH